MLLVVGLIVIVVVLAVGNVRSRMDSGNNNQGESINSNQNQPQGNSAPIQMVNDVDRGSAFRGDTSRVEVPVNYDTSSVTPPTPPLPPASPSASE